MRYSLIREMDISNGEGIGIALFVQGCHFHCRGCFNQETWDFNGGKKWTNETAKKFLELANKPYIKRISILGGEPLADENVTEVYWLINNILATYGNHKKIWLYTGYTIDDFLSDRNFTFFQLASRFKYDYDKTYIYWRKVCSVCLSDVIVDGQFELDKQDLFNKEIVWAGSTNQRIIDVKKSIAKDEIVLYSS